LAVAAAKLRRIVACGSRALLISIKTHPQSACYVDHHFRSVDKPMLSSRRKFVIGMAALASGVWADAPADAQQIVQIERSAPERKAILDVVRAAVEPRLGIKVIFVVERLAVYGDWAFANLHPRTEAGKRIDYRRTLYAKNYEPDLDSDTVDVLLRRDGTAWKIIQEAFLPTDVVWEEWEKEYNLPRALFLVE
jgi:hypothetical protein